MELIPYKNEEYIDWSDENVEAMRVALEKVGGELNRSYPAVIGGKLGTLGANNKVFAEPLVSAGYSAVFLETDGLEPFTQFLEAPKRKELVA